MGYRMIVLIKQVPDTSNITVDAMKEDGTVNRAALPAIFNPEDLNALEMALSLRDRFGGRVTVLTMGPPFAAEALREALYRGADEAILLTDRRFAAADTLATSYALARAIRTLGDFDLVLCGRQAIDGDTAQVGPQVAEKLKVPQVTYAESLEFVQEGRLIRVKRLIEGGHEVVETSLPLLLTVPDSANEPRPPSAKRLMAFKRARTPSELQAEAGEQDVQALKLELDEKGLLIKEWGVEDIGADPEQCGLRGSPTKVAGVEYVTLTGTSSKEMSPTEGGIKELLAELIEDHILG